MQLLIIAVFLFSVYYTWDNQVDVKVCDPDVSNKYVNNIDLAIDPNPIPIKAGATIRVHFGIDVIKAIPVGSKVTLKLHYGMFSIPIPCFPVS